MEIIIKNPSVAHVSGTTEELSRLESQFRYKDGVVENNMTRLRNNQWFRRNNPSGYEAAYEDLKDKLWTNVVRFEDGQWIIRPGSIPFIVGLQYTVKTEVIYPKASPIKWAKPLEFQPYYYQAASVDGLIEERHGHIDLSTGLGKSNVLLMVTQRLGLKTVIVTPSQSIFCELLDLFETYLGKNKVGGFGDGKKDITKQVTVAISKSIAMIKKDTPAYKFFKEKEVIAVDEAHSFSSDTLSDACHGVLYNVPYRFFVSGTQIRSTGQKLHDSIIGKCVYKMTIKQGIEGKFLCPLKFKIINTFSPSARKIKDPMEVKRVHFLRNKEIAKIAAKIANASWSMKQESTLILVEELSQIKMLKDLLTVPFTYVHSGSKKDAAEEGLEKVNAQDEIERFNSGQVRVLIGTRSVSTGVNFYPTHNTINWAGGSSEIVTKQGTMGRSTRKLEISKYRQFHKPKPHSLIYDFDVKGHHILENHLKKRIEYYEETGETVKIVG